MNYTIAVCVVCYAAIMIAICTIPTQREINQKCVTSGLDHKLSIDDIERLCGKKRT